MTQKLIAEILKLSRFAVYFMVMLLMACETSGTEVRTSILLDKDWMFINEDINIGDLNNLDVSTWEEVTIPHDWAISGEFDERIDAQKVQVLEDGEEVAKLRTGRTGGLPHIGVGWYQKSISIPSQLEGKRIHLEFDGVMSNAKVFVNGKEVGSWPYGYASFGFDITDAINFGGKNVIAVRAENKALSSRWYPGAGIYRHVRLVITNPIHVKQWGTFVTTPEIKNGQATVNVETTVLNKTGISEKVIITTTILNANNKNVTISKKEFKVDNVNKLNQTLSIKNPRLWSIDSTNLYTAITTIENINGILLDEYETSFGIRHFEFTSDSGFYLNNERIKLKGVCLHHDLGPLGAAINISALHYRLELLKKMGCNAIRSTHNPPAPELLDLADEMGFVVIDEAFDEWKIGKTENGYSTLWDEWAEKDLVSLIHRDRNHPSVIAWSLGNEIREQRTKNGAITTKWLHDIAKREDPTRPTTAGFDKWSDAIKNGMAAQVDLPAWNYKPEHYTYIHNKFPHWKMYGSETASTVSSRGEFYLPDDIKKHYTRNTYHSNAYETESVQWGHIPEEEFAAQDSCDFMAGEFVWTGFDYLGEPSPYNEVWPSRSSYFGIIDLCGIPKDRYYLYQSRWSDKKVLHILPHWNWSTGDSVPVHCFTNYAKVELFLNGKSLGVKQKSTSSLMSTYRIIWDKIPYQEGELKALAYNDKNQIVDSISKHTAGEPAQVLLEGNTYDLKANGKDIAFITVSVLDNNGILCPKANNSINFRVEGEGTFRAVGNGDPTSLESFVKPTRKAFNGKCMLMVQSTEKAGNIRVCVESQNLKSAQLLIKTSK
ncbi:MAG: DUF4982 domain-containing protein [Bacteroidales bacterium]|nr:DUF4982 domain-containing protein [Bacteroidales bacterium]